MTLPHTCYITIGDWSQDGHNLWDVFEYEATHLIPEQRAALLETEERTGIYVTAASGSQMNDNPNLICQNYQKDRITPFHIEMLRRYVDGDNFHVCDCGPNGMHPTPLGMAKFVLGLIEISLPGFQFGEPQLRQDLKRSRDSTNDQKLALFDKWFDTAVDQRLNAWWCEGPFNTGFGYGIYDSKRGLYGVLDDDDSEEKLLKRRTSPRLASWPEKKANWLPDNMNNYWRLLQECPYEVEVKEFHNAWLRRSTLEKGGCGLWKMVVELSFNGHVFRVWNRLFFTDKRDAALVRVVLIGQETKVRISDRVEREIAT